MTSQQQTSAPILLTRLGIIVASALLASASLLMAQKPAPLPSPPLRQPEVKAVPSEPKAPEMTAADVGAFLDGVMALQLQREDIAGAVISVVKDGKVLLAKGYGYSDVKQKKPVSADATLFRPGSISKLFTWTSVMQLVEQGKLDLDRDVNDYVDFRVPARFGKPLTLRNIMTHTPGFEEAVKDLFVRKATDLRPLKEYLPSHLPQQIFAPGTVPAYSNYAVGMAGYIVERVSGRSYNDYVAEFIFKPLGMTHSTFVQPLPDSLKPLMSQGYLRGSQDAKSFEFVEPVPAGALATTADDMSRFMIAHLQDGRFGDRQILRPETARLMHSRQFGLDPSMNGMALGFYEESRNGHRIIGHGGDTVYFHSDLHLVLDAGLGFFISYNSAGKGEISPRSAVWEKFLDRYFPYTPPPGEQIANVAADLRAVSGLYLASRRSQGSFVDFFSALGELKVHPNADGTLSVSPLRDLNGQPTRLREIAPMTYRDVNGQNRIVFQRAGGGRLRMVVTFPAIEYERAGWPENKNVWIFVVASSLVILALGLILWPVAAAIRWHYGRKLELAPGARRARLAARLFIALSLALCGAFAALVSKADVPGFFSRQLDPWLYLLQAGGVLCALGVVPAVCSAVLAWRSRERWVWSKIGETILALASIEFACFLVHWNLINFNLYY